MLTVITETTVLSGQEAAWDAAYHERASDARRQGGWVDLHLLIPGRRSESAGSRRHLARPRVVATLARDRNIQDDTRAARRRDRRARRRPLVRGRRGADVGLGRPSTVAGSWSRGPRLRACGERSRRRRRSSACLTLLTPWRRRHPAGPPPGRAAPSGRAPSKALQQQRSLSPLPRSRRLRRRHGSRRQTMSWLPTRA